MGEHHCYRKVKDMSGRAKDVDVFGVEGCRGLARLILYQQAHTFKPLNLDKN